MYDCESNISFYFRDLHAAIDYYDLGLAQKNFDIKREGVFRVFDTFLYWTPIAKGCYKGYVITRVSATTKVKDNVLNP